MSKLLRAGWVFAGVNAYVRSFVHLPTTPMLVFSIVIIYAAGLNGRLWPGLGVLFLLWLMAAWFWFAGLATMAHWEREVDNE